MKQLKDNPALQAALRHLQCYRGEVALDSRRTNDLTDIDQVISGLKAEMQRPQEDLIADLIQNAAVSVDISTGDEDFDARIYGRVTEVMTVAGGSAELTILVSPDEPVPSTASSHWKVNGEKDPHGSIYDCERAALTMGNLTDDELANEAFLNYDRRPSVEDIMANKAHLPIAYMTAVKERIRWLSRKLDEASQKLLPDTATLDAKMKAAGMISVSELLAGTPLDKWIGNAAVTDFDSYGEWLKSRRREMLSMQASMDLSENKDSELYEWVVAHAAVFSEAHINFKKVQLNQQIVVTTNETGEAVAVTLQNDDYQVKKVIWQKDPETQLTANDISRMTELSQYKVTKNWQLILNKYAPLIGTDWEDKEGGVWKFFGLIHSDDDYYYGMIQDGKTVLLSCVGNIESFGYTKIERHHKSNRPGHRVH